MAGQLAVAGPQPAQSTRLFRVAGAVGGVASAVAVAALAAEIAAWQAALRRDAPGSGRRSHRCGRDRARPRAPTTRATVGTGRGCRGGGDSRRAWGTSRPRGGSGAVPPPAERRAHDDPRPGTSRSSPNSVAPPTAAPASPPASRTHAVGGSVVSDRQEQAVLAVVRLVGDQEVEVTAQHASSTSAAVTVRIGRALRYLNDQATAAHFHKVWFDAAAHARTLPPVGNPRTATWSGSWGHARTRHRRQRDRPPALQRRDGQRRPAGRQTVPPDPRGATRAARDLRRRAPFVLGLSTRPPR